MDKPKPIDIKTIDLDLLEKMTTENPHNLPYAHHRGGVPIQLDDISESRIKAYNAMAEQTNEQLGMIYEQMRVLAGQAKKIQDRIEISKLVYQANYKFIPVIGESYYLYDTGRQGKEQYSLSLLSPLDWGEREDRIYVAYVKLLADHTWKVLESKI